jgi:hypothetical protein
MEFFRLLARRRTVRTSDYQQFALRNAGWAALTAALLACQLLVPGCRHHSNGPVAEIRIVDGVPDADAISISVSQGTSVGPTEYGTATSYEKIPAGSYAVKVSAEDKGQVFAFLTPLQLDAAQDHRYTGIALGNAQSWPHAHVVVFDDDASPPANAQQSSVRVVDAYPHSVKLDLIINKVVAFHGIGFGAESKAISIPAGVCYAKAIEAGSYFDAMAGPVPMQFDAGKSYLVVILGPDTPMKPGIVVIPDD